MKMRNFSHMMTGTYLTEYLSELTKNRTMWTGKLTGRNFIASYAY
ncbi:MULTISPECIES: hypothetical protein [unclassified Lactococcus]|nr:MULTISPECIES: hypothetical protein [unclassified Lactococcus]